MNASRPEASTGPTAGHGEPVRLRSSARFLSRGEKAALLGLGIVFPGFLCGSALLSLLVEGFFPEEWPAWAGILLAGSVFLIAGLNDLLPRTLMIDDNGIELRDLWTVRRIPLPNVRRVYTAIERGRRLVTVEGSSGAVVTADAFDEDGKRRLFARVRELPGVLVRVLAPTEFWSVTLVRRHMPTPEVRPRWTSHVAAAAGLALLAIAFAALAAVMTAKGSPEVAVVLSIFAAGFVLMVFGALFRAESVLDAALIPFGVAFLFWGAFPLAASTLGRARAIEPPSPWFGVLAVALGATITILGWREMRKSRAREGLRSLLGA